MPIVKNAFKWISVFIFGRAFFFSSTHTQYYPCTNNIKNKVPRTASKEYTKKNIAEQQRFFIIIIANTQIHQTSVLFSDWMYELLLWVFAKKPPTQARMKKSIKKRPEWNSLVCFFLRFYNESVWMCTIKGNNKNHAPHIHYQKMTI